MANGNQRLQPRGPGVCDVCGKNHDGDAPWCEECGDRVIMTNITCPGCGKDFISASLTHGSVIVERRKSDPRLVGVGEGDQMHIRDFPRNLAPGKYHFVKDLSHGKG